MIFPIFEKLSCDFGTMTYSPTIFYFNILTVYSVSQKIPPAVFWDLFPNGWEFLINFLHTYYTFLSTLDYTEVMQY